MIAGASLKLVQTAFAQFMFGINRAIKGAFDQVTLGDLARGVMPHPLIQGQSLGMTT